MTKTTTCYNIPIPSKFIKRNTDVPAPTLKDIVNNSVRKSTFGGTWKKSYPTITKENRSSQVIA